MQVTPEQIDAACALLRITRTQLSSNASVSRATLTSFMDAESTKKTSSSTILKLKNYCEANGVEFIEGGARIKPRSSMKEYEGEQQFRRFMMDVADTIETQGGEICVSGVDERDFEKWCGSYIDVHVERMKRLQKQVSFEFKIMMSEDDGHDIASGYATYKKVPGDFFSSSPLYIYGNKVAQMVFDDNTAYVWVIENDKLAEARRKEFNLIWEKLD